MNLRAAASQAIVAAICFASGAVLIAVARGIENGHGGVGMDLDPPHLFRSNFTVTAEDAAVDDSLKVGDTIERTQETPQVAYTITEEDAAVDSRFKVNDTIYVNVLPTTAFFDRYMADANSHLRWQHRREAQAPLVFGLFASLVGWVLALPAVHALTHVIRSKAGSTVIYPCLIAAGLAVVEFTSEAGTAMTSDWMSRWELLQHPLGSADPGELSPVQAFEMSYMLVHSRTLWLYAMDNLLLAYALFAAACLTISDSQETLSRKHAALGIVTSLACLAGFEVTRFLNWQMSVNAGIASALLIYALLLPIWLVWLGCTLSRVESSGGGAYSSSIENIERERADLESACMASLTEELAPGVAYPSSEGPPARTGAQQQRSCKLEGNTSKADGKRKLAPGSRAVIADASLQDGIELDEIHH